MASFNSSKIKTIIIVVMGVVILLQAWFLFRADAGRYCIPAGIGKEMARPDTVLSDTAP